MEKQDSYNSALNIILLILFLLGITTCTVVSAYSNKANTADFGVWLCGVVGLFVGGYAAYRIINHEATIWRIIAGIVVFLVVVNGFFYLGKSEFGFYLGLVVMVVGGIALGIYFINTTHSE